MQKVSLACRRSLWLAEDLPDLQKISALLHSAVNDTEGLQTMQLQMQAMQAIQRHMQEDAEERLQKTNDRKKCKDKQQRQISVAKRNIEVAKTKDKQSRKNRQSRCRRRRGHKDRQMSQRQAEAIQTTQKRCNKAKSSASYAGIAEAIQTMQMSTQAMQKTQMQTRAMQTMQKHCRRLCEDHADDAKLCKVFFKQWRAFCKQCKERRSDADDAEANAEDAKTNAETMQTIEYRSTAEIAKFIQTMQKGCRGYRERRSTAESAEAMQTKQKALQSCRSDTDDAEKTQELCSSTANETAVTGRIREDSNANLHIEKDQLLKGGVYAIDNAYCNASLGTQKVQLLSKEQDKSEQRQETLMNPTNPASRQQPPLVAILLLRQKGLRGRAFPKQLQLYFPQCVLGQHYVLPSGLVTVDPLISTVIARKRPSVQRGGGIATFVRGSQPIDHEGQHWVSSPFTENCWSPIKRGGEIFDLQKDLPAKSHPKPYAGMHKLACILQEPIAILAIGAIATWGADMTAGEELDPGCGVVDFAS